MSQTVWPLNENGEIVFSNGSGSYNVVGYLSQDVLPSGANNAIVAKIPFNTTMLNGRKLVLIGDSITAQGSAGTTVANKYNNHGWWVHALSILNWPLVIQNNAAVSGRTAQQIRDGFDSEVLPYSPDWIFGIIGQNNLGDIDGGVSAIEAISTIVNKANACGAKLVLGTVTPRTAGNMSSTIKANIFNINNFLKNLAYAGKIILFDSFSALVDPSSSDSAARSGVTYDTLHPNAAGALAIGKTAAAALVGKLPEPFATVQGNGDSAQLITVSKQLLLNPKLTGSSGTVGAGGSGSCATSWQLNRQSGSNLTVAGSKVIENIDGKSIEWQRMVFGGTLSSVENTRLTQSVTLSSVLNPSITVGTKVKLRAKLRLSSLASNLHYVRMSAECIDSVPVPTFSTNGFADSGYTQTGDFVSTILTLETPPMEIVSGTATLRAGLYVAFTNGNAAGTIDITDFEFIST